MIFIFFLLSFFLRIQVYSQTIDFLIETSQISATGESTLKLITSLLEINSYRVRPIVDKGNVYIRNTQGNWINSNEKWTNLPILTKNIHIKFTPVNLRTVSLKFQLQDVKNGKIYSTSEIVLEHTLKKEEYIKNLNLSLMQNVDIVTDKILNESTPETTLAHNHIPKINPSILSTLFASTIILTFITVGALFKFSPPV